MQKAEWDLTPYAGQTLFLNVVDNSMTGWGHLTVDDFHFDADLLTTYPDDESLNLP